MRRVVSSMTLRCRAGAHDPSGPLERHPRVLLAATDQLLGVAWIEAQQASGKRLGRLDDTDGGGIPFARPRRGEQQHLGAQLPPVAQLEQTRSDLEEMGRVV